MMIVQLYARLLRLYPSGFYERFGAEMLEVFTQAWQERLRGRTATLALGLHEFVGLLFSIATEHWHANGRSGLRMMFQRRFVPLWLFAPSLIAGMLISLNYWGYLTVPPSTTSTIQTVDHIALVQFDANYIPSVIPLNDLPRAVLSDFPPSQVLSTVPANLTIDKTLDPALADHLAAALKREKIELGARTLPYPREPVINPNGCGVNCFQVGIQPQTDGSLLMISPEMALTGQPTIPSNIYRLTPDDASYYNYVVPAGYVIQGRDAHGVPLVFTAIASSAVSDDHYRYHELTFTHRPDGLLLHNRMSYNFDIAGIEGFNFVVFSIFLFLPLLLLWFMYLIVGTLISFIRTQVFGPHYSK